jgi:hypothetical protein
MFMRTLSLTIMRGSGGVLHPGVDAVAVASTMPSPGGLVYR